MPNAMRPIHPGEILRDELAERGLSANALARALGVPANRITGILNGTRAITADTALRLGGSRQDGWDAWPWCSWCIGGVKFLAASPVSLVRSVGESSAFLRVLCVIFGFQRRGRGGARKGGCDFPGPPRRRVKPRYRLKRRREAGKLSATGTEGITRRTLAFFAEHVG